MSNKIRRPLNKKTAGIILILILIIVPGFIQACAQAHTSYEVLSLNMTPTNIITGDKVTIEAEVKNTNSETDTYNIPLMVDGVADSRKSVTLDPGQTELLTFELTRSHPGVYKVSVGNKESTLTVEKPSPANFLLSDLQINPSQVDTCESVVITATLANTGGNRGSYTAELKIDGVTNQTQQLTLSAGASCPLCFKVANGLPGTYKVALGDLSGQFVVKEPPAPVFNIPVAPPCPPSSNGSCTPSG
jgi:hypothetical protein